MKSFLDTDKLIDLALEEDLGDVGDVTSASIFSDEQNSFTLISKDRGILCGTEVFTRVMARVDNRINVKWIFGDGDAISPGNPVAEISGKVISILKAERTALNFLSLLSSVSTKAAAFTKEAGGRLIVLDTRKTIPGMRELQKYAVRCGGGSNHRMGLYDMVMIKDNHIDAAGGITAAVKKVREKWEKRFIIEVETRDLNEVKEALLSDVDRIMLDNMNEKEMAAAVSLINGACESEASGNITLGRIKQLKSTGVTYISSGELTNSLKAFDFSLRKK